MSTSTEFWKSREGRTVDGKFPLQQWLGSSDHSAVFLTDRTGQNRTGEPRKAVIKLIPAEAGQEHIQLSRWREAAKLSHPHLLQLFECGRCQVDDNQNNDKRLLYVVMEFAEENLAEILPLRPLAADEASAMLAPTTEALAYLHQSGFVHNGIRPSNLMAVQDQLKISADGVRRVNAEDRGQAPVSTAYDAPEVATAGPSPAADIWSLGAALVAVLTQNEFKSIAAGPSAVPETLPQPLREIARRCLQIDPRKRSTPAEILGRLQGRALPPLPSQTPPIPAYRPPTRRNQATSSTTGVEADPPKKPATRWIASAVVIAALVLVVWGGSKVLQHQPSSPAAQDQSVKSSTAAPAAPSSGPSPEPSPAPFRGDGKPAQTGLARGSVLQQVMPEVSKSAQHTVEGRLKVAVQVSVDASGNVTEAKFVTAGPSAYFASRALAAARRWKFTPPQVNGQATASAWILRFQFRRTSIEVFPSEKNP